MNPIPRVGGNEKGVGALTDLFEVRGYRVNFYSGVVCKQNKKTHKIVINYLKKKTIVIIF